MSEWKECKIADAPFEIIDGDRGTNYPKQDQFNQTGYCLFLNAKNVTTNGFAFNECYFISKEKDKILRKGKLQRNDIILTTRGTVGNIGFFNERIPYDTMRINSGMVIIRSDPKGILPEYTHQLFKYLKGDFDVFATGSAQPQLPIRDLKEISFLLPPLPEQRAIADVLSSLDDKIDLLHRQNKTLEGMAETLWRKMFVEEADPGWKKGKLGDYGKFKNGINYSRNENGDTEYSILNVRDIVESKYVNVGNFEKVSINNSKATPYLLEKGDIVIVRSASPGESLIVLDEIDKLIYSGFSIRMRCYDKKQSLFLFQFLQSYKKEMDIFSDGTTLKNINQEILNSIELITPERDTVKEFNDRVIGFYNKILLNQGQIRTLSRLRDTLLPKLMSGEMRVKL